MRSKGGGSGRLHFLARKGGFHAKGKAALAELRPFRTTWLQEEEIAVEIRKAIISREATHDLPQNAPPPQLPQFVG